MSRRIVTTDIDARDFRFPLRHEMEERDRVRWLSGLKGKIHSASGVRRSMFDVRCSPAQEQKSLRPAENVRP